MRTPEEITALFKKYITNECNEEETYVVFQLLSIDEYESVFKDLIEAELSEEVEETFKVSPTVKIALSQTKKNIIQEIDDTKYRKTPILKNVWLKLAVAAVLFLCVGLAVFIYAGQHEFIKQDMGADIGPGGNKAVLTLADGTKVVLDKSVNGKLASQAGIRINQTDEGKLVYTVSETKGEGRQGKDDHALTNTISTPRGGQYQVNLPDGTKVWLNAESVLTFPLSFTKLKERKVELQGEAYFEVAKVMMKNGNRKQRMPFIVKTGIQEVYVLGTHFNIKSYTNNQETKTTLLEGSVRVKPLNGSEKETTVLKPGQQSQVSAHAEKIKIVEIDPLTEIAWKKGQFFFENEPIESIMKEVARWYDVEIIYQDDVSAKKVWGSVTRYTNISKVLSKLELTGEIQFKVEGRRIIVKK